MTHPARPVPGPWDAHLTESNVQTGLPRRVNDGEAGAYSLIGKQTEGNPSACFFAAWDTRVLPGQVEELLRSFKQFILKGIIVTLIETKFRCIIDLLTI